MDMSLSELQETVMDREAPRDGSQRVGHDWETELNWIELNEELELPLWHKPIFVSKLES